MNSAAIIWAMGVAGILTKWSTDAFLKVQLHAPVILLILFIRQPLHFWSMTKQQSKSHSITLVAEGEKQRKNRETMKDAASASPLQKFSNLVAR